jgi:NAD(P)-dependent dehydrogenase (short-subunit alcohol dehydrogenase family)
VAAGVAAFGRIDVVVNNAGYANLASVEDITPRTSAPGRRQPVRRRERDQGGAPGAARPGRRPHHPGLLDRRAAGHPGLSAYQAAKWAVGGFSEVLAREVGPLGIKVTVLEPGGMQTDWAGSSMRVPPVSEPYRPTVGAMAAVHDGRAAPRLGDPAKVAQVVLEVAAMDEPPLRLILGSEAYAYATAAARARAESDAAWHDLTVSTDRDDATAASATRSAPTPQREPIGTAASRLSCSHVRAGVAAPR